ncbi:hypothetical protein [Pseudomonas baltica]|uniref:Uncharacterized protein n=1 Tax=Pseudomonas baltica TaxID=2762576 RepID=A0A7X1G1R0_9PSED|nr:hypothetical protein [Pseudomonas baltica]MBC2676882.1 hypothetical protein [Pseudomonas baltica]
MTEIKLAVDSQRWIRHTHNGINIRILPEGNEGGSAPTGAKIIAEGSTDRVTWRPLEASNYADAIDEAKDYANQWVDQGMPSSGTFKPIDLAE